MADNRKHKKKRKVSRTRRKRPQTSAGKPSRQVKRRKTSASSASASRPVRRRRRRGRMTLYYILFAIIGTILFAILGYTVFFRVYEITVSGDMQHYSQEEVTECSGINLKSSLFQVNQRDVSARVSSTLPYVESVQVKRHLPTTVELIVTEARPVGAVQTESGYLYISAQGKVLENGRTALDPSIPLLVGITPSGTEVGTYPFSQLTEQIQILRSITAAIESSGLENVTIIGLADRLNLRILVEDRLLVELGTENNLDWKLSFVQKAITQNMDSSTMGVFDVSMIEEDNKGYYYAADNLRSMLLEETEQTLIEKGQSQGAQIQVDPETGAIIVGPHKQSGDSGESSSASSEESSSSDGDKKASEE